MCPRSTNTESINKGRLNLMKKDLNFITLRTGTKMPLVGLGTWQMKNDTAKNIEDALSFGYKMIDTSGDYGTQSGIGLGIKNSNVNREDFYLVTKIENHEDAYKATLQNLKELQLDYADLVLIHHPPMSGSSVELWNGLIKAKQDGFIKDIGVSNFSESQIEELFEQTGVLPTVNQIEWSPFGYSQRMLNYCNIQEIVIQAYSPLTRSHKIDDVRLKSVASRYNKTTSQVLIRWSIQKGVVPIVKSNQQKHMKENLNVFDFTITDQDMHVLNSLNEKYSAIGSLSYA